MRRRIDAGDGDASIFDGLAFPAQRNGDTGQRVVDRPAHPQLLVDTHHTGSSFWQENAREQFVLGELDAVVTDVRVEVSEREPARAGGASDLDLRVETQQRRRRI